MSAEKSGEFALNCPLPIQDYPQILLGHGSGGKLMHQLLEKLFLPAFDNEALRRSHDGAVIETGGRRFALSTDSYVVRPIFFPGGDIGSLAVYGTVNDLAMCGAAPICLSAGFILEEGFPTEDLMRVVHSMKRALEICKIPLVTGDTKVVEKGKGDGLYINTAGIGMIGPGVEIHPQKVEPEDAILLSGDIGRHGIAILAARDELHFETDIQSDSAPLHELVRDILDAGIRVHCMRDLTRGGLATALVEIAKTAGVKIEIDETSVAVHPDVHGACEILGIDPLYVANEGRMIFIVDRRDTERALEILKQNPLGGQAALIGRISGREARGYVSVKSSIGTSRVVDMLSGDPLPRIC